MPGHAVTAIIGKDLRLFLRDRFYLFITVLGLVFYVLVFWLLPATVEESIRIGLHLPGGEALLADGLEGEAEQGLEVVAFPTSRELEAAVLAGDEVLAGLDFPQDFLAATASGTPTTARVLLSGEAPAVLDDALSAVVAEVALAFAGREPPVVFPDVDELVLGVDRSGEYLSLQEQLRPLLLLVVLLVEMFALASLVATEIAQRTITAILATPARVRDVLAAKTLLGTTLAFSQAVLLAALTATLTEEPLLVIVALLLGAVLVTGFGLMAGAIGRDFITIVFWSVAFFVPLAIPAFAMLFPGTPALWIRALPTYGLAETLVRVTGYGEGWGEVWPELAMLLVWCVAAFLAGAAVLGRRVVRV
jgi:ABC-2 type transport system permease protein